MRIYLCTLFLRCRSCPTIPHAAIGSTFFLILFYKSTIASISENFSIIKRNKSGDPVVLFMPLKGFEPPSFPLKTHQNSHHRETAAMLTQYRRGNLAVLALIADPFPTGRIEQRLKSWHPNYWAILPPVAQRHPCVRLKSAVERRHSFTAPRSARLNKDTPAAAGRRRPVRRPKKAENLS